MCDTIVALGNITADGVTLFAKNSDREPNEAHQLLRIPAADHHPGIQVRCTYIDVPQVEHTYAVLLSKPFWIWGAEMGANEHGVVIGNEAVFTKVPYEKGDGLIGMDFIRLALERADTARRAVDVMTELLETYGQGGNCGFQSEFYYHNSFIIADPNDAWVLETAGRQWAAKQVKDFYTISNALTIQNDWDLASDGLIDYAIERGWCKKKEDFNFASCYSDFLYTRFSAARGRCSRTTRLIAAQKGSLTVEDLMATLRDHGPDAGEDWSPDKSLTTINVCMHAGFGPIRINQTTGSMVSHLDPKNPTHFVTGTAAPCTSIFKPVWVDTPLPDTGPAPTGTYDDATLFWRHEALHRSTLRDYATFIRLYRDERDRLEADFLQESTEKSHASEAERAAFSERCFTEAGDAENQWRQRLAQAEVQHRASWLYRLAWGKFDAEAKMPQPELVPSGEGV